MEEEKNMIKGQEGEAFVILGQQNWIILSYVEIKY